MCACNKFVDMRSTPYHCCVMPNSSRHTSRPTLLFGAFDRHNFGDLLFTHVAAAMLPDRRLLFAGVAGRDLRADGGHRVKSAARLASRWCDRPLTIFHAGGELLTCSAWEAAVMLQQPEEAAAMARFAGHAGGANDRERWAHEQLGLPDRAPYVLSRSLFPRAERIIVHAAGGVDLDALDASTRDEVFAKLRDADRVSVRDKQTLAHLATAGITATLIPDPAVMTAELFGTAIATYAAQGEVAQVARAFPEGYVAVQFSAEFGDDSTLDVIAHALDDAAAAHGLGIVFFRAGAAPWHDDLACYARTAARMRSRTEIFQSLHLLDICALIACSRAYAGSSLHGRIVASAFALPRVNLRQPGHGPRQTKQEAFAAAWDMDDMPRSVETPEIARSLRDALAVEAGRMQDHAKALVAAYRAGFAADWAQCMPL